MTRLLLASLALATLAHAQTPWPTSVDITPADVSVRYGAQATFTYLRGRTATQGDRNNMQNAQLEFLAETARRAEAVSGTESARKGAWGAIGVVATRLGPEDYKSKNCRAGTTGHRLYKSCTWRVDKQGRYYQKGVYGGNALATALTANDKAAAACALAFKDKPQLLDYVDLQVDEGRCVNGAAFAIPPHEKYDPVRAESGPLSTDSPVLMDEFHAQLIAASHMEHAKVTEFYCRNGEPPVTGAVKAAHRAVESDCTRLCATPAYAHTADCESLCRNQSSIMPFTGEVDGHWTHIEECTLRVMEDFPHAAWHQALVTPEPVKQAPYHQWIDSVLDGGDVHSLMAHMCAAHKDTRPGCDTATSPASGCFLVRPTCDANAPSCPPMSCQAWMKLFAAQHPEAVKFPTAGREM